MFVRVVLEPTNRSGRIMTKESFMRDNDQSIHDVVIAGAGPVGWPVSFASPACRSWWWSEPRIPPPP
jgi:hypothetical protein